MHRRFSCLLVSGALVATACTPVLKEVRHPGGYPGHILDKRMYDASASKQQQLLRATIVLVMAAEMSRVTVKGEDSDVFARHLRSAVTEIN
ncbi:MAG: hypothetical protein FJ335_07105 [Sphingomonadales bacterium]|nr:hypothetical protein [Sphingomonadales bacterium]